MRGRENCELGKASWPGLELEGWLDLPAWEERWCCHVHQLRSLSLTEGFCWSHTNDNRTGCSEVLTDHEPQRDTVSHLPAKTVLLDPAQEVAVITILNTYCESYQLVFVVQIFIECLQCLALTIQQCMPLMETLTSNAFMGLYLHETVVDYEIGKFLFQCYRGTERALVQNDLGKRTSHFYSLFLCVSFVFNQEDNRWEKSSKNFKCKIIYENSCHNHSTRAEGRTMPWEPAWGGSVATPQSRTIPRELLNP